MKNLYAFTETHNSSPGYLSINTQDDSDMIRVSVRTRTAQSPSEITMTQSQLVEMAQNIMAQFGKPTSVGTLVVDVEYNVKEGTTTPAPELPKASTLHARTKSA